MATREAQRKLRAAEKELARQERFESNYLGSVFVSAKGAEEYRVKVRNAAQAVDRARACVQHETRAERIQMAHDAAGRLRIADADRAALREHILGGDPAAREIAIALSRSTPADRTRRAIAAARAAVRA